MGKENARLSFVNAYVHTVPMREGWQEQYEAQSFAGGFYLDRALKTALFEAYQNNDDTYPVPIAVTDDWGQAILGNDLADFAFTVPESHLFFELNKRDQLTPHSLAANPAAALPDSLGLNFEKTVVKYTYAPDSVAYLPDNDEPSIF